MSKFLDQVIELLEMELQIDGSHLDEDSELTGDCGLESLDVMELMIGLEDEFGITIDDENVAELRTIGDICELLDEKIPDADPRNLGY